ncbi:MAG: CehA/McbA family metallohydrolase [Chloroflexota bacterium]
MHEIVVNLHMHTRYSDGTGTHKEIAQAAMKAGLEAVIVTDHNVLVQGVEGYYRSGPSRVLLLVGQEVHDQARDPQKNHLLIFNTNRDLATLAESPQRVIDAAREAGGLSFIAHPYDPEALAFGETDISWEAWEVQGYTGLELWNGLSELKIYLKSKLHAVFYAYFPQFIGRGPSPVVLLKWDELLLDGKRVVAIGGSDAHALHLSMGPLSRVIFPYEFHFKTVNTHLLLPQPLTGDASTDRKSIYEAMSAGRCFVGYDLPASTRGFRFTAQGREKTVSMGGEIPAEGGVTLQARFPGLAECRLVKDGKVVKAWKRQQACAHIVTEPGIYRIEAYRRFLGMRVGWIFSNPIYVFGHG